MKNAATAGIATMRVTAVTITTVTTNVTTVGEAVAADAKPDFIVHFTGNPAASVSCRRVSVYLQKDFHPNGTHPKHPVPPD